MDFPLHIWDFSTSTNLLNNAIHGIHPPNTNGGDEMVTKHQSATSPITAELSGVDVAGGPSLTIILCIETQRDRLQPGTSTYATC